MFAKLKRNGRRIKDEKFGKCLMSHAMPLKVILLMLPFLLPLDICHTYVVAKK